MKKIAIVSCDRWKDRLIEDRLIKEQLVSMGYPSEIVSWEDQGIDYKDYQAFLLRSVWGYQHKYVDFENWLREMRRQNNLLFNDYELVLGNIRKDQQFALLEKNHFPLIDTQFVYEEEALFRTLNEYEKSVVKPIISGSGDFTFLLDRTREDYELTYQKLKEVSSKILQVKENGFMIQPYVEEIKNGEYACVYIEGTNTHNMLRYPGVFLQKQKPIWQETIPLSVHQLANQVARMNDYQGYLYMRVDLVLQEKGPVIMEVELADPDLLFKYIPNSEVREKGIQELSKKLIRRIEK